MTNNFYLELDECWGMGMIAKYAVKQNYFDSGLPNDILFNNNVPSGIWDDTDASALYPDLNDFEDYQAYQPPCKFTYLDSSKY